MLTDLQYLWLLFDRFLDVYSFLEDVAEDLHHDETPGAKHKALSTRCWRVRSTRC